MKQWQLGREPGHDQLEFVDVPAPRPGPGEVLVRFHAASLNYRDLLIVDGKADFTAGRVPLSDGAGEVVEAGAGVTSWKAGDRVAATFFRDWTSGRFDMRHHRAALGGSVDGVLTELAVLPAHALVRLPDGWSFEEGATLPCAGLTAWFSLVTRGGLKPGDTVLLQGTGGVSIWALQIAAASGATVIITSSSDEKLARARELGATHTINYRDDPEWGKTAKRLTGGRGVDQIVEVGGPGTLAQSLEALAPGGHLAQVGVLTGFDAPDASLFPLVARNATISGIYVGHREAFEDFVRFLEARDLRPIVDRAFEFDQAPKAYAAMKEAGHFGKIVIRIG